MFKSYLKGLVVGSFIASLVTIGVTTFSLGRQAQITPQGFPIPQRITAGSCTGCTVVSGGDITIPTTYKVTVGTSGFITASTTSGVTIATMPAKMRLLAAFVDLTQTYACSATCTTSTLSGQVGVANNGSIVATFDADAAIGQFGLVNSGLGSFMNTTGATASPFGGTESWSGTTNITFAIVSGVGNVGTGAATNLSQGSVTIYLIVAPVS